MKQKAVNTFRQSDQDISAKELKEILLAFAVGLLVAVSFICIVLSVDKDYKENHKISKAK